MTNRSTYAQIAYDHRQEIESCLMGRMCKPNCMFGQHCGLIIIIIIIIISSFRQQTPTQHTKYVGMIGIKGCRS